MSLQDFIAGLGLGIHTPASPTIGPNGPTSSYSSPVGPGTRPGAFLGISGGGRALQELINSNYGLGLGQRGWSDLTGPGGIAAGRGFGSQLVGTGPVVHPASPSLIGNLLARGAAFWHSVFKYTTVKGGVGASPPILIPTQQLHWIMKHPGADPTHPEKWESDPDPDWIVSPAELTGAFDASGTGYYPTAGPQWGQLSPEEGAAALRRLQRQHEWGSSAPWWHNQWLQSPRASGSGSEGGGGTSMAPERLLGGRKHGYDWVALGRTAF